MSPARNYGSVHRLSISFPPTLISYHHMGGHTYREKCPTSRWNLTIPKSVLESLKTGLEGHSIKMWSRKLFCVALVVLPRKCWFTTWAQTVHHHQDCKFDKPNIFIECPWTQDSKTEMSNYIRKSVIYHDVCPTENPPTKTLFEYYNSLKIVSFLAKQAQKFFFITIIFET